MSTATADTGRMPRQISYIIGNEACERFSFYGMRNILVPFLISSILLAYLPTINQTAQLREALDDGPFGLAETVEILRRTWHIEARSVRPDHRMVGHTGFLTTARLLVP